MSRLRRIALGALLGIVAVAVVVMAVWSVAIGPTAVWRIVTHGTTTVWDHLEYPGRRFGASDLPHPWPARLPPLDPSTVQTEGTSRDLAGLLADTGTLGFTVIHDGRLAYEWYAADHGPQDVSMVFSVTKSVLSLLIGAAIDDGILGSVDDPVTDYLPEMAATGFDAITLEDLLRMDTGLAYVEDDNPFGTHVEFNYTADLTGDILALGLRDRRDAAFRYKSGDNAILGLALARALGDVSITEYFRDRLWDPLGAETGGVWSTDHEGGLERTWCCLAVTARDLARLGQLTLRDGSWAGEQVIPAEWMRASFVPGYDEARWPADYEASSLASYGYQWWLTDQGARLALGKDGQYLYVDPEREVVIVRLGETRGGVSWVPVLEQVATATDSAGRSG